MRRLLAVAVLTTAAYACTYSIRQPSATRSDFALQGAVKEFTLKRYAPNGGTWKLERQERVTFDADGRTLSYEQPYTVDEYRYDASGRIVLSQTRSKTNPGVASEYEWHEFFGQDVERVTGHGWRTPEIRRYSAGRLVSVQSLEGAPGRNVAYEYDAAGLEVRKVISDAYSRFEEATVRDNNGHPSQKRSCVTMGGEKSCTTVDYQYDGSGELAEERQHGVREPCDDDTDITDETLSLEVHYSPGRKEEVQYRHGEVFERTIEEFDSGGRLIHSTATFHQEDSTQTEEEWIEYEFDGHGNWTTRKVFEKSFSKPDEPYEDDDGTDDDPRVLRSVEKRTITYYE